MLRIAHINHALPCSYACADAPIPRIKTYSLMYLASVVIAAVYAANLQGWKGACTGITPLKAFRAVAKKVVKILRET